MITEEIIQGCIKNDRKCQRTLYDFCYPIMMRVCKRYVTNEEDASDALNQSFVKVIKNLGNLKNIDTIHAWVKQIAVNTSIDKYREQKKYNERNKFTIDNEYSNAQNEHFNHNYSDSAMHCDDIFKLIQKLPDVTREVLNLVSIDGYSHKEVAEQLQMSEESSRWHLHRARKMMAEMLKQINQHV